MKLKRPLRGSETGADVRMVQRALNKWVRPAVEIPENGTYDQRTSDRVTGFQLEQGVKPASGNVGQRTLDALEPYFDAYGKWRYRLFRVPPAEPVLIEPTQGWASLDKSLWNAYTRGRNHGFSDLGTYNPNSRLPSGAPSDHAVYPSLAFDLGISPRTGWRNSKAQSYFWDLVGEPEISYLILGDKIWSRPKGLHAYTAGGHDNHIHVSGRGV